MRQTTAADADTLRVGSRLVWTIIAAMTGAVVVAYCAAGLTVDWSSLPTLTLILPICAAIGLFYRFVRPDFAIVYSTESIAQILLIGFLGALLSYAAATLDLPYHDSALLAADRWLGFDLGTYLHYVGDRPWFALLSVAAYLSMMWQPAIVFVVLTLCHRVGRLHEFAVALAASLLITIVIFALYPALGWYGHLGIDAAAYPRLQLFWNFAVHLQNVRSGTLHAIPLGDLRGIISFPSYHTAAAVLAMWAIWPVRFVRWPMLALNAMMVASAPIEGSHYLIDVIGGGGVGAAAIAAAVWTRGAIRRSCAESAPRRPLVATATPAFPVSRA
ncbi:MAG: phosphatase PAP2 family protein [Xanthobacteraceae bacterium]